MTDGWVCFKQVKGTNTYSSMAQGEAISLLIRAYILSKNEKYIDYINKAIECLIRPIDKNGTTLYLDNKIYLKEFIEEPVVLNGWIFSIFGLYDYNLLFKNENYSKLFKTTLNTLKKEISKYDLKYWSKYDIEKRIASPFYHKLHSALLNVLGDITGEKIFIEYAEKFSRYSEKKNYKFKAFIIKAYQKIFKE